MRLFGSSRRTPLLATCAVAAQLIALSPSAQAEIVHLQDGTTRVGEITSGDDPTRPLVIQTLDGALQIERDRIDRVESAHELRASLPEARNSDWKAGLRRVEYAFERGLFTDALTAADHALLAISKAKDAPQFALPPRFLDLPVVGVHRGDALDESQASALISLAGDPKRPATSLIARRRVLDVIANPALATAAIRAVESEAPRVREAALHAIARTLPADGLEPAISRMLLDDREDVRYAARAACLAYDHDGIAYPVSRALATDDPQVRAAAMDAAEDLHLVRAVGALVRNLRRVDTSGKTRSNFSDITHTSYVGDFDVEIAQAAVIGQPVVKVLQHGVVQDVAIAGVFSQRIPRAERARIVNLLSSLTGQSFGDRPDRWHEWLQSQKPQDGQATARQD